MSKAAKVGRMTESSQRPDRKKKLGLTPEHLEESDEIVVSTGGKDDPADTEFKNRRWRETSKASTLRRDTAISRFFEFMLAKEEVQAPAQDPEADGDSFAPSKTVIRKVSKREKPAPSNVWQTVAIIFVSFAFAAGIGAVTLADDVGVSTSHLWISSVAFSLLAIACFIAHWDVNRGRKVREYEIEEAMDGLDQAISLGPIQ